MVDHEKTTDARNEWLGGKAIDRAGKRASGIDTNLIVNADQIYHLVLTVIDKLETFECLMLDLGSIHR
jgi:hypothetical protein